MGDKEKNEEIKKQLEKAKDTIDRADRVMGKKGKK